MPAKPIGDRAMTPAERQARRRAKLAKDRRRATTDELNKIRHNIGTIARYLVTRGDPVTLARVLEDLDGTVLRYPTMMEAAEWLTCFADTYRHAAIARQTSLAKMARTVSDQRRIAAG